MAGLDRDLESVIVDLSATSLDELPALDEEALSAVVPCAVDVPEISSRLRSKDEPRPTYPSGR